MVTKVQRWAIAIPSKGDYIAVTFDPQSGHEQKRRRPALVVSNTLFNKHTGEEL